MSSVDFVAVPTYSSHAPFEDLHLGRSLQELICRLIRFWDAKNIRLPHAHILLWLTEGNVIPSTEEIDLLISAEFPDRNNDPEGYELVEQHMIHGPCGKDRPSKSCMQKGECSKNYPKKFVPFTKMDDKGFIMYRRRQNESFVTKGNTKMDNRYVVPHNLDILKKYKAHINVEWCSKTSAIKYLFKYIMKGVDKATAVIQRSSSEIKNSSNDNRGSQSQNEINEYLDCRYLSACESMWRIFAFYIHHHHPAVVKLPVHLEGEHTAIFGQDEDLKNVESRYGHGRTMLTEWFELCKMYPDVREMRYVELPLHFVWDNSVKMFQRRKTKGNIGRITNIHLSSGDKYYLRILVNNLRGPKSFDDLKTVGGVLHDTFKAACNARGFLQHDKEWHDVMDKASRYASPYRLRNLFVLLLIYCEVSEPLKLWKHCWKYMSENQLRKHRKAMTFQNLELDDQQLQEYTLIDIKEELRHYGRSLTDYKDMPKPNQTVLDELNNRFLDKDSQFNVEEEAIIHENLLPQLNIEQRTIYDDVIDSVLKKNGKLFFVYGAGGTGKTFLYRTIISALRCKEKRLYQSHLQLLRLY